jgi:sugar/nucleoside kinase (ribokinase family)
MLIRELKLDRELRFTNAIGIGGIGTGVVFALQGDHTLGRDESRPAILLNASDYCKLHIVEHYLATMMGSKSSASTFHVAAIGVVGADAAGDQLLLEMKQAKIDTEWVRRDRCHRTLYSVSFVYPDGAGGNITAGNSAATTLNEEDLSQAAEVMQARRERCIALCLPEVPLGIRQRFLKSATNAGNFRVASFARAEVSDAQALGLFSSVDLLAVNADEASQIVGYAYSAANSEQFLADCSSKLTNAQPEIQIVVSAGADGAYAFENGIWSYCAVPKVTVVSTAGAGDALLAGILCGLSLGLPLCCSGSTGQAGLKEEIGSALELGLLLASFSVTSPHTIHFEAKPEALERFVSSLANPRDESKVTDDPLSNPTQSSLLAP